MRSKKTIIAICFAALLPIVSCASFDNNNTIATSKSPYSFEDSQIVVTSIGKGKDLILIPGLGSPPDVYDQIAAKLQNNYRIHKVHLKGYAGLPLAQTEGGIFDPAAASIKNFIETKNIKNVAIIGHSMGGELAMAVSARSQGRVAKVLVVDAFTYYSLLLDANATPEKMKPQANMLRTMFSNMPDEAYKAQQTISIARLVKDEKVRAKVLEWSISSNRFAIAQGLYDLMTIDLRPELKNNKAKITLIYGQDPLMGLTQSVVDGLYQNAYKDIPNTNLKRIDNSLHFIMYDQPQAFENAVDEFLK